MKVDGSLEVEGTLTLADGTPVDGAGDLGGGGAGGSIVAFDRTERTAGNVVVSSTTWVAVDVATDLTVDASEGDVLAIAVSTAWANLSGEFGELNVATMVSGSATNYISGSSSESVTGWRGASLNQAINGVYHYQVQAGDITSGQVTLRLFARINTGSGDLVANSTGYPLTFAVTNFGVPSSSASKGFVNHGANASVERPSGHASVEWVGSVEPSNWVPGDTWINTSA